MHLHLTNKEIECLDLIMHGKTSKMIGKILNISYRTVETHMENIKKKLNIQSKSELIDFIFDQVIYS